MQAFSAQMWYGYHFTTNGELLLKESLTCEAPAVYSEQDAWKKINAVWRPIYGGFHEQGISVEWHEFDLIQDWDWRRTFHLQSIEICLNYSGRAEIGVGDTKISLGPEMVAVYTSSNRAPHAVRFSGSLHRFMTLELSPDYLEQFADTADAMYPEIARFLQDPEEAPVCYRVFPMPARMTSLRMQLLSPPVPEAAQEIWFRSKILEVLAQSLFQEDDADSPAVDPYERNNRERVERVQSILARDYENPPTLEMLANEVKCSPFYLSRLFKQETGYSIPRFLRKCRIEKAAEMLYAGKSNVTEAAMAVGYSSLSAFNKAFVEQMGCCPGLYSALKHRGKVA